MRDYLLLPFIGGSRLKPALGDVPVRKLTTPMLLRCDRLSVVLDRGS